MSRLIEFSVRFLANLICFIVLAVVLVFAVSVVDHYFGAESGFWFRFGVFVLIIAAITWAKVSDR